MSGRARRLRPARVAVLANVGTVWGSAASACGTGEATPGRSCCAGAMGAGWVPPLGWPVSAPPFSPPDSPPAGPSHAPLYLRIAHLIV